MLSACISLSSLSSHLLLSQPCWLFGGPFSHLSVCRYCSLCPRARGQCARAEKAGEGRGPCLSPHSSRGSLCPSVFPQFSRVALDHLGVPLSPAKLRLQEGMFCPRTPAPAVPFSGLFTQIVSGLPCHPPGCKAQHPSLPPFPHQSIHLSQIGCFLYLFCSVCLSLRCLCTCGIWTFPG